MVVRESNEAIRLKTFMDNDKGKQPMREEISQLVKRGVSEERCYSLGKGPNGLIVSLNEDVKRNFLGQT